jgi:hypothetical protein
VKPVLIYSEPFDKTAAARTAVRIGDSPNADGYGLGGVPWEPAVSQRPQLSIELMSPDMDGKVQAGQARFAILLNALQNAGDISRLYWQGAPVTIYSSPDLSMARAPVEFTGRITSARPDIDTGVMTVDAAASTELLEKPILTGEFTGGGGILGEPGVRGVLWPAGFGPCEHIEPVWFDTTYNIGMIDGYGNCLTIDRLMEEANDLGAKVADYASYDALKAAIVAKVIKPGQWGTCIVQGLVGLGAPPAGVIGVNATFGGNKPGSIMRRLLEVHAGIPLAQIHTAAFDNLTVQVETLLGRPTSIDHWQGEQREVKDLLEALAACFNATPIVTFQGLVSVTRAIASAESITLNRDGSTEPRVLNWQRGDSVPPFHQLKARTARPKRVLSRDQVNFIDDLVPMGVYAAATSYRAGNTVFAADGSEWLYKFANPTIGNAPPAWPATSNTWWQQLSPRVPTKGSDIGVADGATADLTLIGMTGVSVVANKATFLAMQGEWLNGWHSAQMLTGACMVRGRMVDNGQGNTLELGLDDVQRAAGAFKRAMAFGWIRTGATATVWVNGFQTAFSYSGASDNTVFAVSYDGVNARFFMDGVFKAAIQTVAGLRLYAAGAWYGYNSAIGTHFTDVAFLPASNSEWAYIGGLNRPADNATASNVLIANGPGTVVIEGSTARLAAQGGGEWNSGFYTKDAFLGTAYAQGRMSGLGYNIVLGLTDTETTLTLASVKYGWKRGPGWHAVVVNGNDIIAPAGTSTDAMLYAVVYDGVNVRWLIDGVQKYILAVPASQTLRGRGLFWYTVSGAEKITEFSAGFATDNAFDASKMGPLAPENNATRNVVRGVWAGNTAYAVGDIVQYANGSWHSTAVHSSNASFPPGHASNTQFISLAIQGNWRDTMFLRADAQPTTPTGASPPGWSNSVPGGTATLWQIWALKRYDGTLLSDWSTPGRITGFNHRGAYAPGVTYYHNETVTHNGGTYVATQNAFANQPPSGTGQSNSYWDVLAAPGATGAPATPAGAFSSTITIGAQTGNVNLRALADAAGYTGNSAATITFNVTGNITGLPGGRAIDTGTWPSATHAIALTLNIGAGVTVSGGGGRGGDGNSGSGDPGGHAINCQEGLTIANAGSVRGGGGGGGGGRGEVVTPPGQMIAIGDPYHGGGGGGGGAPNGPGGTGEDGDSPGYAGASGTAGGGGSGGGGYVQGAPGGGYGAAGSSSSGAGGAAGYAVRKNGKAVSNPSGTYSGLWS